MSLKTMTQTEVKAPEFDKIADAILAITNGGREQCHDQDTIRVMLHTFGQVVSEQTRPSHPSAIANECKVSRY